MCRSTDTTVLAFKLNTSLYLVIHWWSMQRALWEQEERHLILSRGSVSWEIRVPAMTLDGLVADNREKKGKEGPAEGQWCKGAQHTQVLGWPEGWCLWAQWAARSLRDRWAVMRSWWPSGLR